MIPARHSEGGSRRSSILKPPKHRQPLQCVVINPASSSSETTSVTTKVKRRVSFAEKKHVKEFCDSFDQGTVWDNTYEENDSSHQKAIHSGNLGEGFSASKNANQILNSRVISIDKENYPLDIQTFEDHHQLNIRSEITAFCDVFQPNLESELLDSSTMDTDRDLPNVLIYTNVIQNTTKTPSEEIQLQEKSVGYNPSLDEENISPSFYSKSPPLQNTIFDNETMAFTKILPSVTENAEENTYVHPNAEERTKSVIHNSSMDFTEAVPNYIYLKARELDGQQIGFPKVKAQEDDGMELNVESGSENESQNGNINETKLNNLSMEMTTAIPSVRLQTSDNDNDDDDDDGPQSDSFTRRNLSMEMTSVVPSIPIPKKDNFSHLVQVHRDDERTRLFRNSMEFTIALPSCFGNHDVSQSIQLDTGEVLSRHKSMEFIAVMSNSLPKQTVESRDEITRSLWSKSMEFTAAVPTSFSKQTAVDPSSFSVESSFNFPDSSEISEKRRRLSIPDMELAETKSLTVGYQSDFENCSHIGVEQTLRRSDGISLLNMELTELLVHNPPREAYYPSEFKIFDRQGTIKKNEVISRASFIVENNLLEPNFQKKSLIVDTSVSQICTPPLSLCYSFLDASRSENKVFKIDLSESDAGNIVSNFSKMKEDVILDEVLKDISKLDVMKGALNVPEKIKSAELSENEAKNVEEVNEDVSNKNCIFDKDSSDDLSEIEGGIHSSFLENNSKRIESEEPPSFLNLSISNEISAEEFIIENGGLPKSHEVLDNQQEDLKDVSRFKEKRFYEACGICETENPVEESLKRCLFQKTVNTSELPEQITEMSRSSRTFLVNQENTNDFANFIKIPESRKTVFESEKTKEITELRTFVLEKGFVIEDCNTCDNRFEVEIASLEKMCKKRAKKRKISGNSTYVNKNSTYESSAHFDNKKDGNSKKEGHDRRYTYVVNKGMNLNPPNEVQIAEEPCKEPGTITEDQSIPFCETKIQNRTEKSLNENISSVYLAQSEIQHEKLTNVNLPEGDISCAEMKVENFPKEIDIQKQVFNCEEERNQDELFKNDFEVPLEEDPFCTLLANIISSAQRDDCIWDLRVLNKKMMIFNFISKSLMVIIKLNGQDEAALKDIKDIQIKTLLPDAKQDLIRIVHDLILHKVHPEILLESHKLYEDVLPLLEQISKEVRLALDFMFELQQLKDLNLMEIDKKRISFITWTKRMDIILKITLNIKPFDEINIDDINAKCLLGSISINEVKQLIINVRRDHKFLRRFMNDVRDYVELMEESAAVGK